MRQNDFIPDEVRWRKAVEGLKGDLYRATDPNAAGKLCVQINTLVHKLNTLGTNAIRLPVTMVDIEAEVAKRTQKSV